MTLQSISSAAHISPQRADARLDLRVSDFKGAAPGGRDFADHLRQLHVATASHKDTANSPRDRPPTKDPSAWQNGLHGGAVAHGGCTQADMGKASAGAAPFRAATGRADNRPDAAFTAGQTDAAVVSSMQEQELSQSAVNNHTSAAAYGATKLGESTEADRAHALVVPEHLPLQPQVAFPADEGSNPPLSADAARNVALSQADADVACAAPTAVTVLMTQTRRTAPDTLEQSDAHSAEGVREADPKAFDPSALEGTQTSQGLWKRRQATAQSDIEQQITTANAKTTHPDTVKAIDCVAGPTATESKPAWQVAAQSLSAAQTQLASATAAEIEPQEETDLAAAALPAGSRAYSAGVRGAARPVSEDEAGPWAKAKEFGDVNVWHDAYPMALPITPDDAPPAPVSPHTQTPSLDALRQATALKIYRADEMETQRNIIDAQAPSAASAKGAEDILSNQSKNVPPSRETPGFSDGGASPGAGATKGLMPPWAAVTGGPELGSPALQAVPDRAAVSTGEVPAWSGDSHSVALHRLSTELAVGLSEGARHIQLRVAPPGLGTLDIAVQVQGTQVNLTVRGEAPELSQHMQHNLSDLQKNLQEHGLNLGHADFGGSEGAFGRGDGRLGAGRQRRDTPGAGTGSGLGTGAWTASSSAAARLGTSRVINVIV